MKIVFRCDSSLLIGTGHVTRSVSLAIQLRKLGHSVLFACRPLEGNIINFIEQNQFEVLYLMEPSSEFTSTDFYENWLGLPLEVEIQEFEKLINKEKPTWVVVDHYALSGEWENCCIRHGVKVFAIDEIFRPHVAHVLLDQSNLSRDFYAAQNLSKIERAFVGPEYALLSSFFLELKPKLKNKVRVENILIFCGGSDLGGLTLRLAKLLKSFMNEHITFHFVVGEKNPWRVQIEEFSKRYENYKLYIQTKIMHELMENADLFIGAGGATTWERCYMGLPSIVLAIAENQIAFSKQLDDHGAQLYLGKMSEVSDDRILGEVKKIIFDVDRRKDMSSRCLDIKVASKIKDVFSIFG